MITVAKHVETIVNHSPLLAELLSEGLGNITEIGRRIQPEIEAARLVPVSVPTIAMALRRFVAKHPSPTSGLALLTQIESLGVKSNLVEFVFEHRNQSGAIRKVLTAIPGDTAVHFLHVSRGLFETIVVADATLKPRLAKLLEHEAGVTQIDNLASLTLKLPTETISTPGVYYPVLKALAWEGISFVEVISVGSELSILFHDRDIDRAFSIVKQVTSRPAASSPRRKSGSVTP